MQTRDKNQELAGLIEQLNRIGTQAPFWKAVARSLNRPRGRQFEVDLTDLQKKGADAVLVPGSVLGNGEIGKKLTVAALRFTRSAQEKIRAAGGETLSIREMLERSPTGAKVMIMG